MTAALRIAHDRCVAEHLGQIRSERCRRKGGFALQVLEPPDRAKIQTAARLAATAAIAQRGQLVVDQAKEPRIEPVAGGVKVLGETALESRRRQLLQHVERRQLLGERTAGLAGRE